MAKPILIQGKGRKSQIKDRTGVTYGRLTAIAHVSCMLKTRVAVWRCSCSCGGSHDVEGRLLGGKSGVKSCGCLLAFKNTLRPVRGPTNQTHGDAGKNRSREYVAWSSMIQRCTNSKHLSYKSYGGRGITVCAKWLASYDAFFADMGRKPSNKHSLDRIDPNAGYQKNNCRWATPTTQNNNKRSNRYVEFGGVEMTCTALANKIGVPSRTVFHWADRCNGDLDAFISAMLAKRHAKESLR